MRPILACFGLSVIAACGSSDAGPDAPLDCSTVAGVDTFVVGLDHAGMSGGLDFKLMSATPAPPVRGDNTWVVQISAMAAGVVGAPVDGASLVVTPFMPAHQHGSPKPVIVTPASTSGQYTLTPVNLWMPGVWETTIQATSGSTSDSAVFKFCIPS